MKFIMDSMSGSAGHGSKEYECEPTFLNRCWDLDAKIGLRNSSEGSVATASKPVVQKEPAHVQGEGASQPSHLLLRNADGAVSARAEESKDPGQAFLLFDRDFATLA